MKHCKRKGIIAVLVDTISYRVLTHRKLGQVPKRVKDLMLPPLHLQQWLPWQGCRSEAVMQVQNHESGFVLVHCKRAKFRSLEKIE